MNSIKRRPFPKGHPCRTCLVVAKCNGFPFNTTGAGCPAFSKYVRNIILTAKTEKELERNKVYEDYVDHLRTVKNSVKG